MCIWSAQEIKYYQMCCGCWFSSKIIPKMEGCYAKIFKKHAIYCIFYRISGQGILGDMGLWGM